ncbi:NadS family protein [Aeromonas simiae]|uniref:Helix-turn-helix domain-containing protein n=1 Tax=Aeromonas simiae TaxID=218936 RepID=A0A5J6X1M6_9GAMM|nr:NadS family protein [Aeromonas simiae]QFI55575.1 helix-turn-helix domain-containing protein [Aeromonas simiae]
MNPVQRRQPTTEEIAEERQPQEVYPRLSRPESEEIKAIRAALNLSQQEFSIGIGVSLNTVKSWESNQRRPTGRSAELLAMLKADPTRFYELSDD